MTHADVIRAVTGRVFTDTNFLGQDLTYYEDGDIADPAKAHIVRGYVDTDPLLADELTGEVSTTLRVHVQGAAWADQGVPAVREGVDRMLIPLRPGEAPNRVRVLRVVTPASHGSSWTLEVEP